VRKAGKAFASAISDLRWRIASASSGVDPSAALGTASADHLFPSGLRGLVASCEMRTPYLSCRVFASFAVERQLPVVRPPSPVLSPPPSVLRPPSPVEEQRSSAFICVSLSSASLGVLCASNPGSLRVNPRVPWGSPRDYISRRNVDFCATDRGRKASTYGSSPAGGGGGCQRQSSTTNHANPTKGMGYLWFPCGTVSSLKRQVGEGLVPNPLASNLALFRRTPYGATTNGAKMRKTNPISPRRGD
jgi:hypothetical protein